MSFFFISLKITLAVVEIEIKHLSVYLNRPAQATFIHVNSPSPAPVSRLLLLLLGNIDGRNPLRLQFVLFLHMGEEKRKPRSSAGKRKGFKDHGQSPSRAVCCSLPTALATCEDYAPNLNLPSSPAEVRDERAAPYSLQPRGFRALTIRRLPLRHAPSHSVLSRRAPAPLRPAACSRTC